MSEAKQAYATYFSASGLGVAITKLVTEFGNGKKVVIFGEEITPGVCRIVRLRETVGADGEDVISLEFNPE
jgi:hypothetical protein